jgi:hypothetical protein
VESKTGSTTLTKTLYYYDYQNRVTNTVTDLSGTDYECTVTEYNNAGQVSYVYGFGIWPVTNTSEKVWIVKFDCFIPHLMNVTKEEFIKQD